MTLDSYYNHRSITVIITCVGMDVLFLFYAVNSEPQTLKHVQKTITHHRITTKNTTGNAELLQGGAEKSGTSTLYIDI